MIKRILFFLLSLCFVAFGHPAWMPFFGPFAGALGYGLFWRSLDSISLSKGRFWAATGWFFIVQLIQMSWLPSVKYQGFYIVSVYLLLALGLGFQFGWITRFVFFRRALSIGSVVAIGAFATLNEWLRLFFLCGFTFNFSGMALTCYVSSMQFASIFGVLGLSYVVFCTNALFLQLCRNRFRSGIGVWLSVAFFPYCFGFFNLFLGESQAYPPIFLNVLLIQPGLSVSQKIPMKRFLSDFIPLDTQWKNLFLLACPYRAQNLDWIIFPESVVCSSVDDYIYPLRRVLLDLSSLGVSLRGGLPPLVAPYAEERSGDWFVSNAFWCQVLSNHLGSRVVAGFDQRDKVSNKWYNAAFYFSPYSKEIKRYEKQILLPIAEARPPGYLKNLAKRYGLTEFFTPGSSPLLFGEEVQAGVSICIEETFPKIMRSARIKGAKFFINLTNDGWYPNTNLPLQHFSHSRVRAVENGISLLRACNTGFTCIVDSKGRLLAGLPPESWNHPPERGALFRRIQIEVGSTLYSYWGDIGILIICFGGLAIFAIKQRLFRLYTSNVA
ncbi:MAG: apolipoprotein N-acyltransferase [Chlamydiae bacterium]|nr:apolipoprotein N-acyltransferase [Chlamydiota bacterium]